MNTTKLYDAQLNVSNQYNLETINNLITNLSEIFDDVYYNYETKSIDIEVEKTINRGNEIDIIKGELREWINSLDTNEESKKIVSENINFVYNITELSYNELENKCIIKLYLY